LEEYKAATASTHGEQRRRVPTASTHHEHTQQISTEMTTSDGETIHNPIIINDDDETIQQWFSPTPEYDPNAIWDLPSVFTGSDTDTLNESLEDFDQQYLHDPDYQRYLTMNDDEVLRDGSESDEEFEDIDDAEVTQDLHDDGLRPEFILINDGFIIPQTPAIYSLQIHDGYPLPSPPNDDIVAICGHRRIRCPPDDDRRTQ
jgi:hypothetical protein